jgi:hypothetical protein
VAPAADFFAQNFRHQKGAGGRAAVRPRAVAAGRFPEVRSCEGGSPQPAMSASAIAAAITRTDTTPMPATAISGERITGPSPLLAVRSRSFRRVASAHVVIANASARTGSRSRSPARSCATRTSDSHARDAAIAAQPGCSVCGHPGSRDNALTGDHVVVPVAHGGAHGPLRIFVRRCNSARGNAVWRLSWGVRVRGRVVTHAPSLACVFRPLGSGKKARRRARSWNRWRRRDIPAGRDHRDLPEARWRSWRQAAK